MVGEDATEALGKKFKRRHVGEAIAWLENGPKRAIDRPPLDVLNVANGLLRWKPRKGPSLDPHTPKVVTTAQLPVAWDPAARCPQIDAFLAEVLPDQETVEFILEVIGYAALAANPERVAVLLLGDGKGT